MGITFDEYQFLKLIRRSPTGPNGYANVSKILWKFVVGFRHQELIDHSENEDGTGYVRLSEKGKTVLEYSPIPN